MKQRLITPILILLHVLILLPATAWTQMVEEMDAEVHDRALDILDDKAQKEALWEDLQRLRVPGAEKGAIVVSMDPLEKALLDAEPSKSASPEQVFKVGQHLPVDLSIDLLDEMAPLADKSAALGVGRAQLSAEGRVVWTTSLQVEGAAALRVHFTDVELPQGSALYLYNDAGQAHGPYTGKGPHGSGAFWSHTIFGEYAWVQLHSTTTDAALGASFRIQDVSHLGDRFEMARRINADANKADCANNVDCVENAECFDWDDILRSARKGVAKISYEKDGGSYICSGGLLNDANGAHLKPWFLTAHHCVSTEASADSLEAFFQYQSNCGSCNGSYVDSVLGADLWATGRYGDFTLLELSELPSSWTLMGWSTANAIDNEGLQLYRISHPDGSPQSFSQHEVVLHANQWYIHGTPIVGTIEGGSSGSPVFREDRKVVGQLLGHTGTSDLCGDSFDSLDGALSYYWKSVRPYLSSPSNTNKMHVADVVAGTKKYSFGGLFKKFVGKATITVVDELGNIVPNARVTGTFSSGLSGTFSATTNDQGKATILHSQLKNNKPSFTFCVTDVTQPYFNTYDSGANDVTCASR